MNARVCSVCRIRETDAYPFPSADWDLCPKHGAGVETLVETALLHDAWLSLMIDRYGHGGI
jgi:hypothetical protein